ncbi:MULTISPECIES: hypothetical protein [Moorena]|uniref:hypothetical protein n=1 Tax=Moorena TaxID=1155738 RepID=UPI0002F166B1|nr:MULTISPECIES: hypothetical protein [Moorena]NEP69165.1 hypothetical protein [Moorena sp. SIO3A5]NET67320.1 hypothetical protein [Moorena sp. SIO1G6]
MAIRVAWPTAKAKRARSALAECLRSFGTASRSHKNTTREGGMGTFVKVSYVYLVYLCKYLAISYQLSRMDL